MPMVLGWVAAVDDFVIAKLDFFWQKEATPLQFKLFQNYPIT